MGKVDLFTIVLQKQVPIYFGGETIVGSVNINAKERFKINGIKLMIHGGAQVRWTERHGSGKSSHTVTYTAYETYMNSISSLMNKQANNDDLYLEAGNHSLPFNVILPPQLPTSFEHQFGKVRYSVQATIDIPWAFDKHTFRAFTVLSHFDLNSFPVLRQSQGTTSEKQVGCLCCKSGIISGFLATAKTGYVPGEQIQFAAKIDNKSSRDVKPMTLDLIEQIRFHSTRKTKLCTRVLGSIRCPRKLSPQELYEWTNRETSLTIPPVASTSNGTCKIIDISYLINLNFDASGISVSTDMRIPIVIGTIPMRDQNQAQNEENKISTQFKYLASIFESTGSYGEEIKGEVLETDTNSFKPFYPYYSDMPAPK